VRLPRRPHGLIEIPGAKSGEADAREGQRLPGRVASLPGQGQSTVAIINCLSIRPRFARACRVDLGLCWV
jgi:hypothetical protein